MPTYTTNYNLNKPLVNDPTDQDLWGGYLNDNMDTIDSALNSAEKKISSSKTADYTVTSSDNNKVFLCDATTASFKVNLPEASVIGNGFSVAVKKTDSSTNTVTVDPYSSETIDGETSFILTKQYQYIFIVCNGTSWSIICKEDSMGLTAGDYTFSAVTVDANGNISSVDDGVFCTTPATTTSTASATVPAVVVENYRSGNNWYRVWSDGWLEQGGQTVTNTTVTFLKAYTDVNYCISMTQYDDSLNDYENVQLRQKNTTTFLPFMANGKVRGVIWVSSGQGA